MKVDRVGEVWKWAEGDSHWRITKSDGMDNWWCKDQFGADGILPERSIARMILVSPPANADSVPEGWSDVSGKQWACTVDECERRAVFGRFDKHQIAKGACCPEHARAQYDGSTKTAEAPVPPPVVSPSSGADVRQSAALTRTQLADKCGQLEAQLSVAVDHAETISLKYDRLHSYIPSKLRIAFDALEKKRGAK